VTPGGASNSLHLAAKTDAKKKEAAWNFIQMAASPEWQNKYALTGSPAPRKGAVTAADIAAKAAAQGRQRRGREGAQPVPRGAGRARELQRLRDAGDQGRNEDDLDAGADREGAGGSAGGARAAGSRLG
jgi:multiple sugar transport system substrate-binding protein